MNTYHAVSRLLPIRVFVAIGFISVGLPCVTQAALTAYDGFDYTTGNTLPGENGGSGFSGAWTGSRTIETIDANGLSYTGLATSGGGLTVSTINGNFSYSSRVLLSNYTDGNTIYISFLIQPQGTVGAGGDYGAFFGLGLGNASNYTAYMGKPGTNNFAIETTSGANSVSSNTTATAGVTYLFVIAATLSAGNDTFSLYINPTLGQGLPATPTITNSSFDANPNGSSLSYLYLVSTGAYALDEIRVGSDWSSVTPSAVPEPSAYAALFGAGAFAFAWHRRWMRALQHHDALTDGP